MGRPFERLGGMRDDDEWLEQRWGGKAASLDRLLRWGFPVPSGFVIETDTFRDAILDPTQARALRRLGGRLEDDRPLAPPQVLVLEPELVPLAAALAKRVETTLGGWPKQAPVWFAVRSSATAEDGERHSFAGVLESFLAVRGEHLPQAILLCWAAAFTSRFAAYCRLQDLNPEEVAVGVVVQELVPADVSGVLLTHDPVTGCPGPLINAVRGLGAALVDGEVEPDQYRLLARDDWETSRGGQAWKAVLGDREVGRVPLTPGERAADTLTRPQLAALRSLARRIERLAGGPQDIEWVIEQGKVRLLQARPVTTLPGRRRVWTRANMKEIMPELPSPMTASLIEGFKRDWAIKVLDRRGFRVRHLAPAIRMLRGRPYLNQTLMEQVAAAAGCDAKVIRRGLGGTQREEESGGDGPDWRAVACNLAPLARLFHAYVTLPTRAPGVLRAAREGAACLRSLPLDKQSDRELFRRAVDAFRSLEPLEALAGDLIGAINAWSLAAHGLLKGTGVSPDAFLAAVTVASAESPTARQVRDFEALISAARSEAGVMERLERIAGPSSAAEERKALEGTRFGEAFSQFLERWGGRAIHETDSAVPRFGEQPGSLLYSIGTAARRAHSCPEQREERQRREAEEIWTAVAAGLRGWEQAVPARVLLLRRTAETLRHLYAVREEVRFALAQVVTGQRRLELELGRRWSEQGRLAAPEDYFWLRAEEVRHAVGAAVPYDLRVRVERRREQYAAWAAEAMPDEWHEGWTAETRASLESVPADQLPATAREKGLALSPGVVEGTVLVLKSPDEIARVRPDSILVTPVIGPNWTAVFSVARGLVVEMAGVLSHGAILAREYGLPAIAGVPGATQLFQDGERVRVDGCAGTVDRLDRLEAAEVPAARENAAMSQEAEVGFSRR